MREQVHTAGGGAAGVLIAERVGRDEPIDLLSPDGRYIGTVTGLEMPRAVSASGLAAWVEKNDLDIEQVVVRRLPGAWK